jgi:excinuclease ABC subunit A
MNDAIVLKSVRTHNLKNIDLSIPHRSMVVITGVSGSGKSSLAFDTLYAEGRRRYVESLSAYARQFLERIEKPDAESITGIFPAIAIEAKNVITNARSTVGTQTEVNDYLRLLFARIGILHCTSCGQAVRADEPTDVLDQVINEWGDGEVSICFPLTLGKESRKISNEIQAELERQGFLYFLVKGKETPITEVAKVVRKGTRQILVVVDELKPVKTNRSRVLDSIESAFRFGKGKVSVVRKVEIPHAELQFSNRFHCGQCDLDFRMPTPNTFSFNSPLGACPECQGFGRVITIDWDLVIPDRNRSLEGGAIAPWSKPSAEWEFRQMKKFCTRKKIPFRKPFQSLKPEHQEWILRGVKGDDYFSVDDFFKYLEKKTYKMYVRILLSRYRGFHLCPKCNGCRLKPEALLVTIAEQNLADLSALSLADLKFFFRDLSLTPYEKAVSESVLLEIRNRLSFLVDVGLGYLSCDRLSRTLSGGESQRIRLAASLGSALVDTLYVLDEPSIGLHERDNALLIRLLGKLKSLGNTVVVVEHDRTMIEAADRVIDMGLLGGELGGEVIYEGTFHKLLEHPTSHTARYFRNELRIERNVNGNGHAKGISKTHRKGVTQRIKVEGASAHNLKQISVEIPLNQFTVITGVSGSGKSTLVYDVIYGNYLRWRGRPIQDVGKVKAVKGWEHVSDLLLIDQSPIGRTPRSNPVTYMKAFDPIRKLFAATREARAKRFAAGHFSFNTAGGRCDQCEGDGVQKVEMHFLADVQVTCEACGGSRYQSQILDIRYQGKNIQEVLYLTIDGALDFFKDQPTVCGPLSVLSQVGLGHLRLGQSAKTLSGGEAQRLKLASELAKGNRKSRRGGDAPDLFEPIHLLYLFDEPTTGLHYYDIAALLKAFDQLLNRGHSVCVIEHNMEVIKCADHIIDLGPEGGDQGGQVLYQGPLDGILKVKQSHTGNALEQYLERV